MQVQISCDQKRRILDDVSFLEWKLDSILYILDEVTKQLKELEN